MCLTNPRLREISMLIHHSVAIILELYYFEFRYGVLWTSYYLLFEIVSTHCKLLFCWLLVRQLLYWTCCTTFAKLARILWTFYHTQFSSSRSISCGFYFEFYLVLTCSTKPLFYGTLFIHRIADDQRDDIRTFPTFKIVFILLSESFFACLNLYWFHLITRKMMQKLRGVEPSSRSTKAAMWTVIRYCTVWRFPIL